MAFNLVDSFKSLITLEVVDKAAAQFGESQAGISEAISGAVPVILAGFVHKVQTGEGEANFLLQEAKDAANNNLSNFSEGGSVISRGRDWLSNLFGNRAASIGDSLASFARIKTASAHSLLAMLAPAGLAVIGKYALDNNLTADGFTSFLSGQRTSIQSALPAGFNVDLNSWLRDDDRSRMSEATAATAHHTATTASHHTHQTVTNKARGTNWLLILILLLAVIALAWYFLVSDTNGANSEAVGRDTSEIQQPQR
jgi:hypothetical protein